MAGPLATEPSAMLNLLPWHGQLMVPPDTEPTVQPACVHTAENALKVPAVGWVTTTCWLGKTRPPPTGTAVTGPSSGALPAASGAPPGSCGLDGAGALCWGEYVEQPVTTRAAEAVAAPPTANTARRLSGLLEVAEVLLSSVTLSSFPC